MSTRTTSFSRGVLPPPVRHPVGGAAARACDREGSRLRARARESRDGLRHAAAVGPTIPVEACRQANASIERALVLAPSLSAARVAQGILQLFSFWFVDAEATLCKGIAVDSADAEARVWHGIALALLGRLDDALADARIAVRLDPLSPDGLNTLANIQLYKLQFQESIATSRALLDLDAKSLQAYGTLAETYALIGQPDSAVAAIETVLKIDPNSFGARAAAMFVFASVGRWKDVDEQYRQAIRDAGNSPNFVEAFNGVISGDLDAALVATERGVRTREPWFSTIGLSCEPIFSLAGETIPFRSAARHATQWPATL